jgi:hypothetical protein
MRRAEEAQGEVRHGVIIDELLGRNAFRNAAGTVRETGQGYPVVKIAGRKEPAMFADTYLTHQAFSQADLKGASEFEKAMFRGWLNQLWARLAGRSRALKKLPARPGSRHYVGLQTVAIDQIGGTEDRDQDFDPDFNPLQSHSRDRWLSIFKAMRRGVPLPPVELTRVDGVYYVRDGHHRISVARLTGQGEIEAIVTEWN